MLRRCLGMSPDVVYVCGRVRRPGEMNGKSANLNNCLNQIYPPSTPIPAHEIVCIFDADQARAHLPSMNNPLCSGMPGHYGRGSSQGLLVILPLSSWRTAAGAVVTWQSRESNGNGAALGQNTVETAAHRRGGQLEQSRDCRQQACAGQMEQ